ncbi:MAG: hypothetical protein ACXAEU_13680 [Candidatus Hodarchaeales archaeon]|jgi:hypothetical protein
MFWFAAYTWLKKYWKWILFPVGLIGLLVAAMGGSQSKAISLKGDCIDKVSEAGDKAVKDLAAAAKERDQKLSHLKIKYQEHIDTMGETQKKKLEELQDKPIEEVIDWFNKL